MVRCVNEVQFFLNLIVSCTVHNHLYQWLLPCSIRYGNLQIGPLRHSLVDPAHEYRVYNGLQYAF